MWCARELAFVPSWEVIQLVSRGTDVEEPCPAGPWQDPDVITMLTLLPADASQHLLAAADLLMPAGRLPQLKVPSMQSALYTSASIMMGAIQSC